MLKKYILLPLVKIWNLIFKRKERKLDIFDAVRTYQHASLARLQNEMISASLQNQKFKEFETTGENQNG